MENDMNRVYYIELECFEKASEKLKNRNKDKPYIDLSEILNDQLEIEIKSFLLSEGKRVSFHTITYYETYQRLLIRFLKTQRLGKLKSFNDRTDDVWMKKFKAWLMSNGRPISRKKVSAYGTESVANVREVLYLQRLLDYVKPEEEYESEWDKDVWELDKLDITIRKNPIYHVQTIRFTEITQQEFKTEVKRVIRQHLKEMSLGSVQLEMTVARTFSKYLSKKYPKMRSCMDMNREILENYITERMTSEKEYRGSSDHIRKLQSIIETAGKLYQNEKLENLFLNSDIPPELDAEFKVYSDSELIRFNRELVKVEEQIARCVVLHQMLGTRISDTLTLETDCLYKNKEQYMVTIHQVKTTTYEKPVSEDVARLIEKSIEYTQERFGYTKYIFVDEQDQSRPLQYTTIKHKILTMINRADLKDDRGEQFRFGTHVFRHFYGVKLTDMHLDDWSIARLLGHKRLNSVNHYRRISNHVMADETRAVRKMMSDIMAANIEGWEKDCEQIRQNARRE